MEVTSPMSWGKLKGTLNGVACDATSSPLEGAVVQVDGRTQSWTLMTGSDGTFAWWLPADPRLQLVAAKDGYVPRTQVARVIRGQVTTVDLHLRRSGC